MRVTLWSKTISMNLELTLTIHVGSEGMLDKRNSSRKVKQMEID